MNCDNVLLAFTLNILAGLATCALVGFFILIPLVNDAVSGIIFASVAVITVYISLNKFFYRVEKHGEHHIAMHGIISGMVVITAILVVMI